MAKDYFIKEAIKHKGSLRSWAKKHHFMHKDGTINLNEAEEYARRHHLTHRIHQIELARRLASFR